MHPYLFDALQDKKTIKKGSLTSLSCLFSIYGF